MRYVCLHIYIFHTILSCGVDFCISYCTQFLKRNYTVGVISSFYFLHSIQHYVQKTVCTVYDVDSDHFLFIYSLGK